MSDAAQSSSRKSLIATSMAAVVLSVDQSPGINWVVDIDGAWTWSFLLAAHSYFFTMFIVNGAFLRLGAEFRGHIEDEHGQPLRKLGRFRR